MSKFWSIGILISCHGCFKTIVENNTWARRDWNFSLSVQLDIELNTRREILYFEAAMYYFVYYINILLKRKSCLNSHNF